MVVKGSSPETVANTSLNISVAWVVATTSWGQGGTECGNIGLANGRRRRVLRRLCLLMDPMTVRVAAG